MKQTGIQQMQILEQKLKNIRKSKEDIMQKHNRLKTQIEQLNVAEHKILRTLASFGKKKAKEPETSSETRSSQHSLTRADFASKK